MVHQLSARNDDYTCNAFTIRKFVCGWVYLAGTSYYSEKKICVFVITRTYTGSGEYSSTENEMNEYYNIFLSFRYVKYGVNPTRLGI